MTNSHSTPEPTGAQHPGVQHSHFLIPPVGPPPPPPPPATLLKRTPPFTPTLTTQKKVPPTLLPSAQSTTAQSNAQANTTPSTGSTHVCACAHSGHTMLFNVILPHVGSVL